MSKKLLAFQPLSGIYEETWTPYEKFTEWADMSVLLEHEGKYYRILRNTLDWKRARKMLVCDEDGHIVEDKAITKRLFNYYVYLDLYDLSEQNIKFDQKQADRQKHEPMIEGFKKMVQELQPVLSDEENEAMSFHLYYFEEVYRLSVIIADLASKVGEYRSQLKNVKSDRLSSEFMEDAKETLRLWRLHRKQIDSLLIEDGEKARPLVKKILKSWHYRKQRKHISNWNMRDRILKEMQGANYATKRYVKEYEKEHQLIELNLGIEKGPFSIDKLIEELRTGVIEDQMIEMSEESFLERHWALSDNCIFK